MDIKPYIAPLIKYWWLLVLACVLSAGSSFVIASRQPPVYQSRTTLVVGRSVFEANPSGSELGTNVQLARFYVDLATRAPVRNATRRALGLERLPEYTVAPVPNSSIIEIVVVDSDPERAQKVANELANQLILNSPTSSDPREAEHEEFINEQLVKLENEIRKTEADILQAEGELATMTSARQIADAQAEINALRSKLATLQNNYITLFTNSSGGASNQLTVLEPAQRPSSPVGPNKISIMLLSMAIGLTIASGSAYLLEYLDDTLRSTDEIIRVLGLPVIGHLGEVENEDENIIHVAVEPNSIVAEAYRALRSNIVFLSKGENLRTILVTSPDVAAGKTSVSVNLATVLAQGGKDVLVVDADLRKHGFSRYLDSPNQVGFGEVLEGKLSLDQAITSWKFEHLKILPAGNLDTNPADLMASQKMEEHLKELGTKADLVIIDGPPILVTDAALLASYVDGVLLVIRHGQTKRAEAKIGLEQLRRTGARIVGVVYNHLPKSNLDYYMRYGTVSKYYFQAEAENAGSKNGKLSFAGLRRKAKSMKPEMPVVLKKPAEEARGKPKN